MRPSPFLGWDSSRGVLHRGALRILQGAGRIQTQVSCRVSNDPKTPRAPAACIFPRRCSEEFLELYIMVCSYRPDDIVPLHTRRLETNVGFYDLQPRD
jgi:hypothetical protein